MMITALCKLIKYLVLPHPLRSRFGLLDGARIALLLRRHASLTKGEIYSVKLPSLLYPISLRAGTSDLAIFFHIFVDLELDFDLVDSPSLIIDAGANIGLSSLYLATRYPSARIVALEIDRDNFEMLQRNTKHYPSILPLHKGLWSNRARLAIANRQAASHAFRAFETVEEGVEAVGIADLLREYGSPIGLLKMDIEGAEKEIFEAHPHSWLDGVGTIAVELHDRSRQGCRESMEKCIAGRDFFETRRGEYTILTAPGLNNYNINL